MKRKMSVSGAFYPGRAVEIERYFEHFSAVYDEAKSLPQLNSRVVIVPHAGYIYSGYSANVAYRVLRQSGVKKFAVIGPSHKVGFEGASLCEFGSYETPFGDIDSSISLHQTLKDKFNLPCILEAHHEHSTEVQFPFIKHYINATRLDNICLEAIENLDAQKLHCGCEACGKIGIEAVLLSAKKLGLKAELLDYSTSADASGDTESVVGYVSACFY